MKKIFTLIVLAAVLGAGYWYINRPLPLKVSATDVIPPKFLFKIVEDYRFDKKNGLNMEYSWSLPGEVERRLVDRTEGVEVGFFNVLAMVNANLNDGHDLRIIAPVLNIPQVLMVRKNSPFYSVKDLKNARLTIRPKGTAAYTAQAVVLKVAGYDIEKDFKVAFGEPQQGAAFLEQGEADAVLLSPPDAAPMMASGKFRLITELDELWVKAAGATFPFVDIAADADWIASNPRKVERFRAVMKEAVAFILENPELLENYREFLDIKSDAQLQAVSKALIPLYSDAWDFAPHRLLLKSAVELGFLDYLPPNEEIFAP